MQPEDSGRDVRCMWRIAVPDPMHDPQGHNGVVVLVNVHLADAQPTVIIKLLLDHHLECKGQIPNLPPTFRKL